VLPVTLQSQKPEPKQRDPIAIYIIIDRSNSMGYATSVPPIRAGEKMEYAKRAALSVLEQLGPADLVGAIAFDAQPYQLGLLQPLARGGPALVARIRALQYGGGTDFKEALQTALAELLVSRSRVRHVILLTDGDTNRHANDHMALIADYAARRDQRHRGPHRRRRREPGAPPAHRERDRGEFHHVESLQALPQIMIRDAQRRIDMAADRSDAVARFGTPGPILTGLREEELPPVARWAVTRQKPGAELRLYVERDGRREPILSTWQYGLGRAAALPLDFQAGAAGWAAWPGFAKLLASSRSGPLPPAFRASGACTPATRPPEPASTSRRSAIRRGRSCSGCPGYERWSCIRPARAASRRSSRISPRPGSCPRPQRRQEPARDAARPPPHDGTRAPSARPRRCAPRACDLGHRRPGLAHAGGGDHGHPRKRARHLGVVGAPDSARARPDARRRRVAAVRAGPTRAPS
jgi:hypothetical protein